MTLSLPANRITAGITQAFQVELIARTVRMPIHCSRNADKVGLADNDEAHPETSDSLTCSLGVPAR